MATAHIGIPYLPGSNGKRDMEERVREFGMRPHPFYFHIGHKELDNNERMVAAMDGLVLPGGFPYEDRLGFGRVAASIKQYARAIKSFVGSGKPVLAVCAGNQSVHALGLFPDGYQANLSENICDRDGKVVSGGFYNGKTHVRLASLPQRNAFTRIFENEEVLEVMISHSGGRFSASASTIDYMLKQGLIVTKYCDAKGNVTDNFPVNPNGSFMNIESVSNRRGNVLAGMAHHERKLNALKTSRANLVFASMREYIEDGCPDLSVYAQYQKRTASKDFSYLMNHFAPEKTLEIAIEMRTDDNELNTAKLFTGGAYDVTRRRVIRVETTAKNTDAQDIVKRICAVDILDGIMLKKDVPTVTTADGEIVRYERTRVTEGGERRKMVPVDSVVENMPSVHYQVDRVNIKGHHLLRQLTSRDPVLREKIAKISVGKSWHFKNDIQRNKVVKALGL